MATYRPLIPTGTVPLNTDYTNLQENFQQANTVVGIDHSALDISTNEMGYHKSIHMIPQASITNTPGFGQLYSNTVNSYSVDQALFWDTGNGNQNIQLTSNFLPTASTIPFPNNGYSFLPGTPGSGIIIQWGYIQNVTANPQTVTYASIGCLAFPNNTLNVQLTSGGLGSQGALFGAINLTPTGFDITQANLNFFRNYYFVAIGY